MAARYKIYRYKQDELTFSASDYECENDQLALAHAMELAGDVVVELWQGDRMIAHIAPTSANLKSDIERMRKLGELPPESQLA